MSKRVVVKVDCKKIVPLMRKNEWNNSAFSRKVGKYNSWFSEVSRGKNLPSPEEAARMCILLNTTPEEILLREGSTEAETAQCQQDIETVRQLVEEAQGAEKAPDPKIEGLSAAKQALLAAVDGMTDEQCEKLLPIVLSAKTVL